MFIQAQTHTGINMHVVHEASIQSTIGNIPKCRYQRRVVSRNKKVPTKTSEEGTSKERKKKL